jgi:hypothetical protein
MGLAAERATEEMAAPRVAVGLAGVFLTATVLAEAFFALSLARPAADLAAAVSDFAAVEALGRGAAARAVADLTAVAGLEVVGVEVADRAAGLAADRAVADRAVADLVAGAFFAAAPDLAAASGLAAVTAPPPDLAAATGFPAALPAAVADLAVADFAVALADFAVAATDFAVAVTDLAAAGLALPVADLAVAVGVLAVAVPVDRAVKGLVAADTAATIRLGAAEDLVAEDLVAAGLAAAGDPATRALLAPVVAARVGAFLGTAMGKFLLANDCGLVSAWRLQDSGLDTGVEPA